MFKPPHLLFIFLLMMCAHLSRAQYAEPWQSAYSVEDASGAHVVALWKFDEMGDVVADVSGNGHDGKVDGAALRGEGRFGGCMESFPGWPVEDVRHAVVVSNAPELSPYNAFTIEMWICPAEAPDDYGQAFLVDKKYVSHQDYQWILEKPDFTGNRRMRVVLGFGEDSDTWWSADAAVMQPQVWTHLAFTYDGAGTVHFFQDGRSLGKDVKTGRGSIHPGSHVLSLGDRVGSLYYGFPGRMDEVRITRGVREFRPITVSSGHLRTAYLRLEPAPVLQFHLRNNRRDAIQGIEATVQIAGMSEQAYDAFDLLPDETHVLEFPLNTRLREGAFEVVVSYDFGDGDSAYANRESFGVDIVPRRPPHRMPVVMWGVGGVEGVMESLPLLKEIGFTHCLGLRCDYQRIWEAGTPVNAVADEEFAQSVHMLDQACVNDLGIIIGISPGHWLEQKPELLRVNRAGEGYDRSNICGNFPEAQTFALNVGTAVAQTYGDFPAFQAALIHTEVRDGSQLCFHEHDHALYRAATGLEIPERAERKNGVSYGGIEGFPASRVVPDDHDLLRFYRWFWREGDGWNALHSAVNAGLKSTRCAGLWTFFDPAVRVPALWGSGGDVDFLSHWTYSYPDPIRIGLAADELFAMAKGGPEGQDVMKMTQIIWYRSQTAPISDASQAAAVRSPWEDYDPDADYITIAPMHLREAFWTKIARPVKGIMYHGWQSLVPTEGRSAYRFTHPETRHALQELIASVVEPLGPMLLQVPAAPADIAFLESFSSAMFAGRGTYGWGGSWAGDAYHILLYAQMQPEIIYEESLVDAGLEGYKVLVLADCDVLTESAVERILAFQQSGGILIGDARLCPAIKPDILLEVYARTKNAHEDKEALLARARGLEEQIAPRYQPYVRSSVTDVLPYRRRYGTSDYIFAINDRREFGSYVGHHGLVMENGLPATAAFEVKRSAGYVYDLLEHREVPVARGSDTLRILVELEPGGGGLWLITETPVAQVRIEAPQEARRSDDMPVVVSIVDDSGNPVNAVIPLRIEIRDPDGRQREFSGYYGARDGQLSIILALAPNDTAGIWTIEAQDLAAGRRARHFFRLIKE